MNTEKFLQKLKKVGKLFSEEKNIMHIIHKSGEVFVAFNNC